MPSQVNTWAGQVPCDDEHDVALPDAVAREARPPRR